MRSAPGATPVTSGLRRLSASTRQSLAAATAVLRHPGAFSRNVATVMLGTLASHVLLLASLPVLARLYAPAEIGVWQTFVSLALLLSVVLSLRYEVAIVLPDSDRDAANVLVLSFVIAAGIAAVVLMVIIGSTEAGLAGSRIPQSLVPYLALVPLAALLLNGEQSCMYWLTRSQRFAQLSLARLLRVGSLIALQVGLVFGLAASSGSLVAATIVAQLIATGFLAASILRRNGRSLAGWLSWDGLRKAGARYRNYPFYIAPYSFLNQVSRPLILLLLARFAGGDVVGLFALSLQIVFVPVTLFSTALNQVFYPKAAREYRDGQLDRFVVRVLRYGVLVFAPVFVLFWYDGSRWLETILGGSWEGVGRYAVPLSVASFMQLFTSWLDRTFDILGRQRLAVALQVTYDLISIGLLVMLLRSNVDPAVAVAAYAAVAALYNVIWLFIAFRIARFPARGLVRVGELFALVAGSVAAGRWLIGRFV